MKQNSRVIEKRGQENKMKIKFEHSREEILDEDLTQIEVYDKREKITESVVVKRLSETKIQVAENAVMLCRLTFGTEFETRINKEGVYEITKITKDSKFITRRFLLSHKFTESEYRVLGDEIMKQGGFWQVDLGGIATVNLPQDSTLDLDEVFRIFDFQPTEFTDE